MSTTRKLILAFTVLLVISGLLTGLHVQRAYSEHPGAYTRTVSAKSMDITISRSGPASVQPQTISFEDINPGYYCQSAFSSTARNNCAAAGATGMAARFFWCQLVDENGIYNFSPIANWVIANDNAGLRSIIGTHTKDLRTATSSLAGIGSCTAESNGSPSWVLTGIYNDDINGVAADPLENPEDYEHLNYLDREAQAQIVSFVRAFGSWMEDFAISNPAAYASIEAVEVMFGEQDSGAGVRQSWYPYDDRNMYRCRYAGGVWDTEAETCSLESNVTWPAASTNWRDNFTKPLLDEWGNATSKPKYMVVSNALANAKVERAYACAGCNGQNIIDYAFNRYGIGSISTGGNVDAGNGNGSDPAGEEYVNWFNILKMRWRDRITALEAGVMFQDDEGDPQCCDTEREIYWNGLQAIDYGAKYVFGTAGDLAALVQTQGSITVRDLHKRTAGRNDGWSKAPVIGIWFRDTDGSYYPDGDNGTYGLPNMVRGESPCCSWMPNYNFLIYQNNFDDNQIIRKSTHSLPNDYRSWWARRTTTGDASLKLRIDGAWPMIGVTPVSAGGDGTYQIKVTYLDSGLDQWSFVYPSSWTTTTSLSVTKTGTGQWRTYTADIEDWDLTYLINNEDSFWLNDNGDGVDTFHSVIIEAPDSVIPDPLPTVPGTTATPPPLNLPICTRAPETYPTIPVINTPTPTPTRTATPTTTPTVTPTPTPS